jgi:hypothetical protein
MPSWAFSASTKSLSLAILDSFLTIWFSLPFYAGFLTPGQLCLDKVMTYDSFCQISHSPGIAL